MRGRNLSWGHPSSPEEHHKIPARTGLIPEVFIYGKADVYVRPVSIVGPPLLLRAGRFCSNLTHGSSTLPLTVPVGAPLHIALTKKVPVKHAGVPVEGKVVENVYVFDHLVIPAGSRVMGQVTKVDNAPRKERALAIANGNFTPLRHAHVDFNTLVEADGKRIPLQTNVSQGAPSMVHMVAGANEKKKKGRVASKVERFISRC